MTRYALLLLLAGGLAGAKDFVHPGLMHAAADLARMKAKVAAGAQPWTDGYAKLLASPLAQLGYRARPSEKVIRGNVPGQNFVVFAADMQAAYQSALRWAVSGDAAYAQHGVDILNAWSSTLKAVEGNSDRFLAVGIYGYQAANAAEILRTWPGWAPAELARFQQMLLTIFYPMNHDFLVNHNGAAITNYWANWDLCNIAAVQAIGVLCDRRDLYDEAMTYLRVGRGNGALDKAIYYLHPGNLGQWQESGRDQGHNTLGIALMGPIMESAWNQGDDLYGADNNAFLAGAEYVAKYNLGEDVPYEKYAWGLGQRGDHQEQPIIAAGGRPAMRVGYELVVNHYVKRRGIAAPWSEAYAAKLRPEVGGGGHASTFDQPGLGTLTFTREAEVAQGQPTGLTARRAGGSVELSWWGGVGLTGYRVQRAEAQVWRTVADHVSGLLTCTDTPPAAAEARYRVVGLRDGGEVAASEPVPVATAAVLRTHLTFADGAREAGALQPGAVVVAGRQGKAVALDGKTGYVTLPTGVVAGLSDFTIAAWVKLEAEQTWSRVFDFGDGRGRSMFLATRGKTGARFSVSTTYYHNEQVIDSPQPLPVGRRVHVAVTLSGRRGTLYVDGQPVGTNEAIDFPPWRLGQTDRNWIGRSLYPTDPYLRGQIEDFRIYDGALGDAEVAALAR